MTFAPLSLETRIEPRFFDPRNQVSNQVDNQVDNQAIYQGESFQQSTLHEKRFLI